MEWVSLYLQFLFGFTHTIQGLGGVASPLVCQAIIARGVPWFHFYFGSLVLSAINVTFLVLTFKPTASEFLRDRESAMAGGRTVSGQTSSSEDYFVSKEGECESPTSVEKKTTSQRKSRLRVLSIRFLLNLI
jgi:hypothetical protein